MIEILNEGNFDEKVLQSSGNVLVEFFATWCPHCQRMMPIINEVADRVQGQAVVYQVDVDKSPDLAQTYAPNGFPSFALFVNGQLAETLVGEQTEERLLALVAKGAGDSSGFPWVLTSRRFTQLFGVNGLT